MTDGGAFLRVRRAERTLRAAAVASAAFRAIAVALALVLVATFVDATIALEASPRRWIPVAAAVAGAVVFAQRLRRSGTLGRRTVSTALWIETRFPALRYALVTAVDPSLIGSVPALEKQTAHVPFEPAVRRAAWRAVFGPGSAALLCGAAVFVLPRSAVTRVVRPRAGRVMESLTLRGTINSLATIVVRVSPPAYAGLPHESFDDPASVRALVGSGAVVEGRDRGDTVIAEIVERGVHAVVAGGRWSIPLTMPDKPIAVRLRAGSHERLLLFEPIVDSVPVVTLTSPSRDTTYRRPSGVVRLAADATDDFALASGQFEYIVSSGGGETFTFKSGAVGATSLTGRIGALASSLSLDSLHLRPGDLIHVRAIARDRNNVTGPGIGASETRTIRIARADEYDSVAVGAAPPEPAQNALSQRMILLLTEALQRKRRSLSHADLVRESRNIAVDQSRLRQRVGEIVFTRLGEGSAVEGNALERRLDRPVNADSLLAAAERATTVRAGSALEGNADETPLVALNRPLLEAYNHMWNASTELEIGEPGKAISWMRKALDALQVARASERVYLRGNSRPVVVDVERVRLAGKIQGAPSARTPRAAVNPGRLARLVRFDAVLTLVRSSPAAAADSLLLLRLDVLGQDDLSARDLEVAANALRRAGDATPALARARRSLAGSPLRTGSLSSWGADPW